MRHDTLWQQQAGVLQGFDAPTNGKIDTVVAAFKSADSIALTSFLLHTMTLKCKLLCYIKH